MQGLIIAAPSSGSGKTVVTLGLLRHLNRLGVKVASAKVGPDYIDPAFHSTASRRPCHNLDAWAMRPQTLNSAANSIAEGAELVVCEGVMGLFDGAFVKAGDSADGSTAHMASMSGWPVVLVVDARAQAGSAAAVVRGFVTHRQDVRIGGVIFNRVGSESHARILNEAMEAALPNIPVLGCLPMKGTLTLPSRHLGLVQAIEHPDLEQFIDGAANLVEAHVDVKTLRALAGPWDPKVKIEGKEAPLPRLGQRIAVAQDQAFQFHYPLTLDGWRKAGVEISFFSPLANESPTDNADGVYLPGGYPELHGGQLAANQNFLNGLRQAADKGAAIFGECGGYMVLGKTLVDSEGNSHAMAGLLDLETSFAKRKLHLGYRRGVLKCETPFGAKGEAFKGHEFHYASIIHE
ncbi:MAG: cobyrinate a,c-diamide synthase, partial [Rhodospirillales bacterium]|nr:cobyrinate a,c-diamide synthase [Rhodospirillales bacterium]